MSKKEYDMNEKSSKEIKKHRSLGGGPYMYIYIYICILPVVEQYMSLNPTPKP